MKNDFPFIDHVQALSPLNGDAIDGSRRPRSRPAARRLETPEFPVTVTRIHPSARRLTRRQEERGAEMFAAGKSEREVARALGVGNGTAHRLRERIAAKKENGRQPVQEVATATVPVGTLADLETRRAQLARELEELDTLLLDAHRQELREAMEAAFLVAPRWEPLAGVWGRLVRELDALDKSLYPDR